MTLRAALLAVTSAVGLLLARALDGLGLLPGVTEDAAVRRAALDLRWTALGVLLCLLVGVVAARLLSRSRALALSALLGGQLGLVVGLEETARELNGGGKAGEGEAGLWLAATCQLVLSLLAVATALVVVLGVPRPVLGAAPGCWTGSAGFPPYRAGGSRPQRRGWSGRGPPVGHAPLATH
ncbi:MAG TPA: hypothetical protein VM097_12595 [Mycobacteriales bacterium]|nr:hypothetical protein [Mycobacteriales bacterium]